MIFFPFHRHEDERQNHRHKVCDHDGDPNAVDLPNHGKKQNRADLEHQGPQEGDQGGDLAVAQSGEEGGAEDVEPHQQEGQGVQLKTVGRQSQKGCVIAHENPGHR